MLAQARIHLPREKIVAFCRKWQIVELALFGSVLRDDFRSDSDVDVLVTFTPNREPSFLQMPQVQNELAELLGRRVDLVKRRLIEESENYIRRRHILDTAQVIYAA